MHALRDEKRETEQKCARCSNFQLNDEGTDFSEMCVLLYSIKTFKESVYHFHIR